MHIKLDSLSHQFNSDSQVLKNISFEDKFSNLAIIGASGSGKSTLLRILAGLITQSSGKFYFNHEVIDYDKNNQWRKKIAFVFQNNGLFPHLSGLQNIMLPLMYVFNISEQQAKHQAYALLERFNLQHDANKFPYQLSGGQCQRISIIRAIVVKPQLLLLDEPTSALDPEYTSEVLSMIHELTKENQNIILVTHEMGFAKTSCDKIIFLSDGNIEEYGSNNEIFSKPKSIKLQKFLSKILEWK